MNPTQYNILIYNLFSNEPENQELIFTDDFPVFKVQI